MFSVRYAHLPYLSSPAASHFVREEHENSPDVVRFKIGVGTPYLMSHSFSDWVRRDVVLGKSAGDGHPQDQKNHKVADPGEESSVDQPCYLANCKSRHGAATEFED